MVLCYPKLRHGIPFTTLDITFTFVTITFTIPIGIGISIRLTGKIAELEADKSDENQIESDICEAKVEHEYEATSGKPMFSKSHDEASGKVEIQTE